MLAAALWAGSRVGYALFGWGLATFNSSHGSGGQDALWIWGTWDAEWYMSIAAQGYRQAQQANFLPLYPALGSAITHVFAGGYPTGRDFLVGLLAVSNLSALGGLVLLARLADLEIGAGAAPGVLLLAVAAPAAFFTAAAYSEGLELLLAVGCIYAARTGRWRWAAACAFAAAVTRWTAFALVLPLAWEYGRQHGWWRGPAERAPGRLARSLAGGAAVVLAAPAGLVAWSAALWSRFGDPLVFLSVRAADWHMYPAPLWRTLLDVFPLAWRQESSTGLLPLDVLLFAVLAALTAWMVAARMPAWMPLFMAGLLAISVSALDYGSPDLLQGATRHFVLAIPAYLFVGGVLGRRAGWLPGAVAMACALLQGLLLAGYLTWNYVF